MKFRVLFPVSLVLMTLAACGDDPPPAAAAKPAATPATTSPGKPTAPVALDYEVLGKALVGLPVAVNVRLTPTGETGPVAVDYSIDDDSALRFQEGQVERLEIDDLAAGGVQQVTVIPQREGRLYVNVSVTVQVPGGSMIRSLAIPIQVGSAPQRPQVNGELAETADGETVISMPASESQD